MEFGKKLEENLYMFTYFKMKYNEWKFKIIVYKTISNIYDNQKEFLRLLQKIYIALKDVPTDELRKEFVSKLAEIIHEENKDKKD